MCRLPSAGPRKRVAGIPILVSRAITEMSVIPDSGGAGEFRGGVVDRFVSDYASGRTPNPCIECNRTVKFDRLLNGLGDFDCEVLVTGHHARNRLEDGVWALRRGEDRAKDQSYVLSMLTQTELAATNPAMRMTDELHARRSNNVRAPGRPMVPTTTRSGQANS